MNLPAILPSFNRSIPFNFYDSDGLLLIETCSFVSLLINVKAVKQVGLPYKEFCIWGDDQEYTRRITKASYLGLYCIDSIVLHKTPVNYFPDFYRDTSANICKHKTILNAIPPAANCIEYRDTKALNIRMIGRLTNQKNHFLFLEVANNLLKKYPELSFSILGAGIHDELAEEIDDFLTINNLKKKVNILHWGDTATSSKFLTETDIFVMPSVFEGLPFALLEAMSQGIPCVVSKVDGNTDLINNNENGFSCLNVEEFCSKIEMLVNDVELRKKIGLAGREYVSKHHCICEGTKKLEKIYREM